MNVALSKTYMKRYIIESAYALESIQSEILIPSLAISSMHPIFLEEIWKYSLGLPKELNSTILDVLELWPVKSDNSRPAECTDDIYLKLIMEVHNADKFKLFICLIEFAAVFAYEILYNLYDGYNYP